MNQWVFERSSGYAGYRCDTCATWVYQDKPRVCKCPQKDAPTKIKKLPLEQWGEFHNRAIAWQLRGLRRGQSMMTALNEMSKETYNQITGTELDPYYVDEKIFAFKQAIFPLV